MKTWPKIAEEYFLFLAVVFLLLFALAYFLDSEDYQTESNHYCEMVYIFVVSGGEDGWPDYKGTYNTTCNGPVAKGN